MLAPRIYGRRHIQIMSEKAYFVLNGEILVIVDKEKAVLCEEVFKHFTEVRWASKCPTGELSFAKDAGTLLNRLYIPHEIIPVESGALRCMQLWPSANDASGGAPATPLPDTPRDERPPF